MKCSSMLIPLAFIFLSGCNQAAKSKQAAKESTYTYDLPSPQGWGKETFPIPISFAPAINYNGHEDIRFAPGWGDSTKADYWTYAFLWCINSNPNISDTVVENNLRSYYDGLVQSNRHQFHLTNAMIFPTETDFKQTTPVNGDLQTYTGTIKMLDYMQQKPQILQAVVHLKFCEVINKYMVFHQVSPRPYTDTVWNSLNRLWTGFTCGTPDSPGTNKN